MGKPVSDDAGGRALVDGLGPEPTLSGVTAEFSQDVQLGGGLDAFGDGAQPEDIPVGEFLEGVAVTGSASFDTWLLTERQRVTSELLSCLRQATLRALSSHQPDHAVACAAAMVQRNPLDEGPHVLLVKSLAATGDAEPSDAVDTATDEGAPRPVIELKIGNGLLG